MDFDEPTRQRIAQAVRDRRAELGLSQEQAARASGGMISTANLRVVEGAGRSSFRPKSLLGVARALSWPADAVELIAGGADPATLPSTAGASSDSSPPAPSAGGLELATAAQVADLQEQVDEQRVAIAELGRRLTSLAAAAGAESTPWASGLLAAANSGDLGDVMPEGGRTATPSRTGTFDPDVTG